ncbi:hypothetical protein MMYC01_204977 [Madurella mycetomatis]|uniref:Uncharacterized protein n=1 Tax=Madurella mycetomatis TaxID=100816 RepID=A0A175W9T0_9PEZI|nr:hypothetical protein MMYC01_204977 [Madurella mycetomatis]
MARDVVPSSWDPTHHPNPHHHVGAVSQKFESIEHNGLRNGYYRGPDEYPQVVHDADLYDRHGQNEDDDWDMCDDTGRVAIVAAFVYRSQLAAKAPFFCGVRLCLALEREERATK